MISIVATNLRNLFQLEINSFDGKCITGCSNAHARTPSHLTATLKDNGGLSCLITKYDCPLVTIIIFWIHSIYSFSFTHHSNYIRTYSTVETREGWLQVEWILREVSKRSGFQFGCEWYWHVLQQGPSPSLRAKNHLKNACPKDILVLPSIGLFSSDIGLCMTWDYSANRANQANEDSEEQVEK